MSSSQRVRPSTVQVQTGRFDNNESGRLSSYRLRKLLGENCTLDNTQLEALTEELCALADFTVTAFVEQRKRQKIEVSEQLVSMPEAPAPVLAVA
jgi:hypothetical protein